jgi:hypothetical protein
MVAAARVDGRVVKKSGPVGPPPGV